MLFAFVLSALSLDGAPPRDAAWLAAFHAGERGVLESCYREHFDRVSGVAATLLRGVDAETVTHDVFLRLLSEPKMRESFVGGDLGAWLSVVTKRAAIDALRKIRREAPMDPDGDALLAPEPDPRRASDEADAKLLVERFRREVLPEKYARLFEVRFLRQLPQREAARELGMQRSTLAYQEQRVRELLTRFLLDDDGGDE